MNANFVGKFNVQAAEESFGSCITGIAVISTCEIVLADYYNNSLIILDVRKNAVRRTHTLSKAPWDVTAIDGETVAATLPDNGQILFVSTKTGQSPRESLDIREGCWGIDHNNGVIAVSFSKPSAIHILDMKGNILHEISGEGILNSQSYISLAKDNSSMFVSYNQSHAVHQLTIDANQIVAMKCGDLKFPAGLVVMRNGTVIVCGIGNSDKMSILLPGTSEFVLLPVNDLHKPCCVAICEEENKMYICEDTTSVDRNIIKIYDLK